MLTAQVTQLTAASISSLLTSANNPLKSIMAGGTLDQKNSFFQALADGLNQVAGDNHTGILTTVKQATTKCSYVHIYCHRWRKRILRILTFFRNHDF